MFYLIYVSSAVRLMDNVELLKLHQISQKNNKNSEITGMLLYQEGNFMQIIEGEEEHVLELFIKISMDKRHKDIYKIMSGPINKRNFDNWSMGFCNMNDTNYYSNYETFIQENIKLKTFEYESQSAYDFIIKFNETNR
ncbi:MAG: hypothetical protein ACI8Y3_001936 [Paraglaciecola sp.]|jgi:hypothetical protein